VNGPKLTAPSPSPEFAPFDAEAYRHVLDEVYDGARRVRATWMRVYRTFLRSDAIFGIVFALTVLVQSSEPSSLTYPWFGLTWCLWFGALVFFVVLAAIPGPIQRRLVGRWTRQGKLPSLDAGPSGPTLEASAQVFGRLQKEWSELLFSLIVSALLLAVALLGISTALLHFVPAALASSAWGGIAPGIAFGILGVGWVVWLLLVASWGRRIRALHGTVRAVERRFGELEGSFWRRI